MANKEHLRILKQGVGQWNLWRKKPSAITAYLSRAYLREAYLREADLREADLSGVDLRWADLSGVDLSRADLSGVELKWANLIEANLRWADLSGANLIRANLSGADLMEANISTAYLGDTLLGNTNLTNVKGLGSCLHSAPSTIDHRTLLLSGMLPVKFLRGCGLPDALIDYLPSLLNQPIQFYSCFISYSSKDENFAQRLHSDLQDKGVRCWYAPHDLKIGDRIRPAIDDAIRIRDKLLIVLSDNSLNSQWVEEEVETAFEEEKRRGKTVLFPVRLDDAVMQTDQAWAADIRRTRHIGDFRSWKDDDKYQVAFRRLLRDLKVQVQGLKRAL